MISFKVCFGFTLLSLAVCGPLATSKDGDRIVGGFPINITDAPYQIVLLYRGQLICGGSIISNRFVLTAAHCVEDDIPENLSIRYGSQHPDKGGVVLRVEKIKIHPKYTRANDIAVLKLKGAIVFSKKAQPIKLAHSAPKHNDLLKVSGYGTIFSEGPLSGKLMAVHVPAVSFEKCKESYGSLLEEGMICAGLEKGGKDSCQGDSGGPLVNEKLEQVGVVSFGYGCGWENYPGVYADVSYYQQFIKDAMREM